MEKWKDIPGYEGLYQVSALGRVKSLSRTWTINSNIQMSHDEIIIAQCLKGGGYWAVNLIVNGKTKNIAVHILVAKAYIPNFECKKEVNHKNGVKTDNRVENLEWVTRSENLTHAYVTGLRNVHRKDSSKLCKRLFSKPVMQLTKDGIALNTFPSDAQASRETGVGCDNINMCVRGKSKTAGGFIWRRIEK